MTDAAGGDEKFHGSLIRVRVQPVEVAPGRTVPFEIVEHPDAVAIVALRWERPDDPNVEPLVALVRLRRPAVGGELWEIPAGLVEPSEREEPQRTAERELREETGATAAQWKLLAREYPSPGFSTECISIYLATGVELAAGTGPLDREEIAEARWVPLSEALAMRESGAIQDGKTLLGLMLARDTLTISPAALGGAPTMPLDPTNMPLRRDATFRQTDETAARASTDPRDATLKMDNMLLEEYNYASTTAYQANEDRARIFNLYLLLIGVIGSAIGAIFQIGGQDHTTLAQPLVIILLIVSGFLGFVFFYQLIKLRKAKRDSMIAMGKVREYYIEQFKSELPRLDLAFHWRLETIPAGETFGSVNFLISYTVAFLGSLCLGGAAYLACTPWLDANQNSTGFSPVINGIVSWCFASAIFLIALVLHIVVYVRSLNTKKEKAQTHEMASEIESIVQ